MTLTHFDGISWLGQGRRQDPNLVIRDFKDRYGVNYTHEGRVRISVDHAPPVWHEGPVAWLSRPGHFEYGTPDRTPWANRYVNFTGPRVARFIATGLFDAESPVIPVTQGEKVRARFDELHDLLVSPRFRQPQAVHLLEGLLLLLTEQRSLATQPTPRVAAIHRLCGRIRTSPKEPWDARDEAARLGLSLSGFRKVFHDLTGLPPHQFILRTRMEVAAGLLERHPRLQVQKIGEQVGFPDIYGFSRHFKKHFKLSPKAFRQEGLGK